MTYGLTRLSAAYRGLERAAHRTANDCALTRYLGPRHWPACALRLLETWVRERPAQYLWTHRHFRTNAAEHATGTAGAGDSSRLAPRIPDTAAAPLLILATALFITVFDNTIFWSRALEATLGDTHQGAVLLSLLAILICTLVAVLALAVGLRTTKLLAGTLLMVSAVTGFFMTRYGVVVDLSMIRNIFETQAREAAPLFTSAFALHVVVYGVAPAVVVALVPVRAVPWRRGLAARLVLLATSLSVLCGAAYANYGPLSFFAHEHRSLRLLINPGYPLYALSSYLTRANDRPPPERVTLAAERDARLSRGHKPTLFVLVLGETARADRFSLNGYARETNRYTSRRGVTSFSHVTSCGTSTADSVPCLFSDLGHARFSHAAAAARESLFGLLQRVGVDAFWRDNSTGCKHVCDPAHFAELAAATDPRFCDTTGCFDEILLDGLEELVADAAQDHFIVLHQRGSHGPAYHTDTPEWIKTFQPECALANLRNCSRETLNNAYDNTILYTDYFVSRVIDFLESRAQEYDVGTMYVSDHGESLGENGLYLHGFPYTLAPQEQLRVPLLFWAPTPFYAARGIDSACLSQTVGRPLTHDSIFHTILPLFFVSGEVYRSDLDAFAPCRRERDPLLSQLEPRSQRGVKRP